VVLTQLRGDLPCYDCNPPQEGNQIALCTIANHPRTHAHCIDYAKRVLWPKQFPDREPDTDILEDVDWIYKAALKRAEEFGISGVTPESTLGVIKNIIPIVASTNAVVSAIEVAETIKRLSMSSLQMIGDCYYAQSNSIYNAISQKIPKSSCQVCNPRHIKFGLKDNFNVAAEKLAASINLPLEKIDIFCGEEVLLLSKGGFSDYYIDNLNKTVENVIKKANRRSQKRLNIKAIVPDPKDPSKTIIQSWQFVPHYI